MQLTLLDCPSCGGKLTINPDDKIIECPYCKHQVAIDDQTNHVTHHIAQDDMEEAGYRFERGRQQAQKDARWLQRFEKDPNKDTNDGIPVQTDKFDNATHGMRTSRRPSFAIGLVSICALTMACGLGYAMSVPRGDTTHVGDTTVSNEPADTVDTDSWYIYGDHLKHPDNKSEQIQESMEANDATQAKHQQLIYSTPTKQFLNLSEDFTEGDRLIAGHYREFYQTNANAKGYQLKPGKYQLKNESTDAIDAIVEIKREDRDTGSLRSENVFSVPADAKPTNIAIPDDGIVHDVYVYPYGACVRITEQHDAMFVERE